MLFLYNTVIYALVPFILVRYYLRARKNSEYARRLGERFGLISPAPKPGGIWVHAVSVGESVAAIKLIKAIQALHPEKQIIMTCATPTGSEIIKKQLGDSVYHVYVPLDLPGAVKRFLAKCRPSAGIFIEKEIWPNLFHYAHRAGVTLIMSNMLLSQTSYRRYKKFASLTASTLSKVSLFAVQTKGDADRVIALGALPDKVAVVGNLKFEMTPSNAADKYKRAGLFPSRQAWLAGSTHLGEEALVLSAHSELLKHDSSLLLILAPRHPERFEEILQLSSAKFKTQRRSELGDKPIIKPSTEVLLLDTMGELVDFIRVSDFCFIGGSMVAIGGHNILEACQAGVPVIYGPYMGNSVQIAKIVADEGAGIQVKDQAGFILTAKLMLTEIDFRIEMGKQGRALISSNQGSVGTTLDLIEKSMGL